MEAALGIIWAADTDRICYVDSVVSMSRWRLGIEAPKQLRDYTQPQYQALYRSQAPQYSASPAPDPMNATLYDLSISLCRHRREGRFLI